MATSLIGAATAWKIFRFGVSAVKEFAAFERSMANVSTMLNKQTRSLLPDYTKQIISLTKEYGQTSEVLSKGLYDILSASIDASKAMEVLEISTQAAIGGMTDAGIAADAITTVLNAYSLSADEAGRASDLLFSTVRRGKITFGELASGIGKVASIAATSGLSLEEVGAAIATMTRAGIQSDIAMTSLRAILLTFLSPTRENVEAARAMGFELDAATLASEGLTGVVQKLIGQAPSAVAGAFSNARGIAGLAALIMNAEGHLSDLGDMADSTGARLDAFRQHVDTTALRIEKGKQAWVGFKRELGSDLAILIADIADISGAMSDLSEAGKKNRQSINYGYGSVWAKTGKGGSAAAKSFSVDMEAATKMSKEQVRDLIKFIESEGQHVPGPLRQLAELSVVEADMLKEQEAMERMAEMSRKQEATRKAEELQKAAKANELRIGYIDKIKKEIELVGLSAQERDKLTAVMEFEAAATAALGRDIDDVTQEYNAAIDALEEVRRYHAETRIRDKYFGELEKEQRLLGKTSEERERAIKLQQLENELRREGVEDIKAITEEYEHQLEVLQDAQEDSEFDEMYRKKAEGDIRNILRGPMDAALQDRDIEEVLKEGIARLGTTALEYMYEKTIVDPVMTVLEDSIEPAMKKIGESIMDNLGDIADSAYDLVANIFGGIFGTIGSAIGGGVMGTGPGGGGLFGGTMVAAKGRVFENGNVTKFGKGGVLPGPTIFPMANGGLALGGEAGYEALMPLGRDATGKLGVAQVNREERSIEEKLQIVNVIDDSMFEEYLGTGAGERRIVNIVKRNASELNM